MNEEQLKQLIADAVKENVSIDDVAKQVVTMLPKEAPTTSCEKEDARVALVKHLNYLKLQFKAAHGDARASATLHKEKASGISGAGYAVPPALSSTIIEHGLQTSEILSRVQNVPMASRSLNVPVSGIVDTDAIAIVDKAGLKPVVDYDFTMLNLVAKKRAPIIAVPDEFVDEFVGNAVAYISNKLNEAVNQRKEIDVVASVLTASGAQNVPFSASDNLADKLLNLQDAVNKNARMKGVYLMNNSVISQVRTMKDSGGRYIYQMPGEKRPAMLWDRPVFEVESMPSFASVGKIAAFVNLSNVLVGNYGEIALSISTEATLKVNGSTTINLWQQNMTGIRVESEYDVKVGLPEKNVALLNKS